MPFSAHETWVATPTGERLITDLNVGDLVVTRDNGSKAIRWIGRNELQWRQHWSAPQLRPVVVRSGALASNQPDRDFVISPNQRVLALTRDADDAYGGGRQTLVAAKHMINNRGVDKLDTVSLNYVHLMCDISEMILVNGSWVEAYNPNEKSISIRQSDQHTELLELFPGLSQEKQLTAFERARMAVGKPVKPGFVR